MKKHKLIISSLVFALFTLSGFAQVMVPCLTMEQAQAKYNQDKANATVVRDTASQQMQCYYQQLATYWNQVHKDKQQREKDIQQVQKDAQQAAKDLQQVQTDQVLAAKLEALNECYCDYDEVVHLIEIIVPLMPECSIKEELKKVHTNRSGHADGTSPGGQTQNLNGFLNPGYLNKLNKGL